MPSALATGGYTQDKLAERLGVSQGHVGNRLGLLKLPPAISELVAAESSRRREIQRDADAR